MKLFVVCCFLLNLSASGALPSVPMDNSHYVEGKSRYIWMPDDDGKLHLEDLHLTDEATAHARQGADNQYWLFTRQNRANQQTLRMNNINSVRNSNYNSNRGLAVVVHGLRGSGNNEMSRRLRDYLLNSYDINVIVVDWSGLANRGYATAKLGVPSVGQYLGDFLLWLMLNTGGNWGRVHLIGFSLGAHVVGNAGRRARTFPNRVTGLDPAGPSWDQDVNRLRSNAGRYVEIIHTDNTLGIITNNGHADFYPNGGSKQPGCSSRGDENQCSHSRAWDLFASSLNSPNRFQGRLCSTLLEAVWNNCRGTRTATMGNSVFGKSVSGIYALTTSASWPY